MSDTLSDTVYAIGLSLRDRGLLKPEEWLAFALLKSSAEVESKPTSVHIHIDGQEVAKSVVPKV